MMLTFLFVYCYLFANYYSKIIAAIIPIIAWLDPSPDVGVW